MTIQLKANAEQNLLMVQSSIQKHHLMKQYFPVVLFNMLYKVVSTSADETLENGGFGMNSFQLAFCK